MPLPAPGEEDDQRMTLEPHSDAFAKVAREIKDEIARRRRSTEFAIANTRISGNEVIE